MLDDNRKLRDFWVINSISDKPELKKYKYEFPGDKYVTQNELVIIDIVERTARKAKIQKWNDQYVMPFNVTSDSKYVFLNVPNVHGMRLMCVRSIPLPWKSKN